MPQLHVKTHGETTSLKSRPAAEPTPVPKVKDGQTSKIVFLLKTATCDLTWPRCNMKLLPAMVGSTRAK
jgi:hypothetical protein